MPPIPFRDFSRRYGHAVALCLLSATLLFGAFLADGNVGTDIDFSDEGFLWYGMRAFKMGLLPIRDFQAYDPGRYLWSAGWSLIFGESLLALRFACVIFAWIGLTLGLLAARRVSRSWFFLLPLAVVLALWMFPRYKVFEQSISLMAIYVAVRLIERPTLRQHFITGIFVGFMAFMGRNHGLYQAIAFGLIMLLLARGTVAEFAKRVGAFAGGIFAGYLPQIALGAFVPGYSAAYVEQLRIDVKFGTNLAAPVPWPWKVSPWLYGHARWDAVAEGWLFVALLAFLAAALLRMLFAGRAGVVKYPLFAAGSCVALTYTHYAFSRPDMYHLTHSVPAMIVGTTALCHTFGPRVGRWLPPMAALLLLGLSVPPTVYYAGIYSLAVRPRGAFLERSLGGKMMRLPPKEAAILDTANHVAHDLAFPGEAVLFLPHFPGLYPATGRLSPIKPIYLIYPATPESEAEELADIEANHVGWVLLQDVPLDGRDELRFRNTNPLLYRHLMEHYETFPIETAPSDVTVFRLRQ
jgi:hypothetical protein